MRLRLTALALLASSVAVLLFALPLALAVARYLVSDERSELQRLAATVAGSVHGELSPAMLSANPALRGEQEVTVYGPTGSRLFGSGPQPGGTLVVAALTGRAETSVVDGRLTAAAAISDGDAVIAAVTVSTPNSDLHSRIGWAWAEMAAAAVLAVALTGIAARQYSRRLSRPLEHLAETARHLGTGQRAQPVRGSSIPEVDTIAHELQASAKKLYEAHERERRFTTDASHQLRTPLAALRLTLESALLDERADPRAAMNRALTAADHIQDTIDTLLRLARDRPTTTVALLADLLARARDRWSGTLAALNRPLRLELDPDAPETVRGSASAMDEILDVLLDNAARHGTGTVTITVRSLPGVVAIDISNPGPLIALPDQLFQRRNAHAHGNGIGLPLARSLAEADGARLTLTMADPPTFTLLLPSQGVDGPG